MCVFLPRASPGLCSCAAVHSPATGGGCVRSGLAAPTTGSSLPPSALAEAFTVCQLLGTSRAAVHAGKWSPRRSTPSPSNSHHLRKAGAAVVGATAHCSQFSARSSYLEQCLNCVYSVLLPVGSNMTPAFLCVECKCKSMLTRQWTKYQSRVNPTKTHSQEGHILNLYNHKEIYV